MIEFFRGEGFLPAYESPTPISHRERAAAAAGALGGRVGDAEAAAIEVVVEIHGGAVQIDQAALIDHDGYAVEVEDLVELVVDRRVEVQLVLVAAAPAADYAQTQIDLLRHRAGFL